MEGQQAAKLEYDEILNNYSKRKTANETNVKKIQQLQTSIPTLESELEKYGVQASEETVSLDKIEIAALTSKLHQYQHLIKQVESDIKNDEVRFRQQVSRLEHQRNHHHSHLSTSNSVQSEELSKINEDRSSVKRTVVDVSVSLTTIQNEIQGQESVLAQLQAELAKLSEVTNSIEQSNHDATATSKLQEELKQYEKVLAGLQKELNAHSTSKKNEKDRLQTSIKTAKDSLLKEQNQLKEHQAKKKSLENQPSNNENQRLNQLQNDIKRLEAKNGDIQKEIDTLAQTVQTKKAEKAAQQQELKKYKEKKEKNYKLQILDAEKTHQNLLKEMERQKGKLADVLRLSKTYVSQENLQILQKQLARHQAAISKVNIQAEQAKKNKHVKENEVLKSRIQFLRTSSKNLEDETDKNVRQLKKIGDQLVREKLAQEKVFNQTTNKLNEYMKEFPDHQKKKQLQKLQDKRRKLEEKQKIREASRIQKEKIKEEEDIRKKLLKPVENQSIPAWEKWDQVEGKSLPSRDQASIFNNRQVQLVIGAVAFVTLMFLAVG